MENAPGYNSAYLSLNLLDELDYCLAGYGKPNVEFLFTLNTFVETFIASSEFYTSLDELNHLNLTTPVLFPNGRPILNLVVREGGLKFVNGVVNNPSVEIYRIDASDLSRKEAQREFVIDYGRKIKDGYFIQSNVDVAVEKIPLITSKIDNGNFVVSEVRTTTNELVSNLMKVSRSTNIQTSLPIYLYGQQVASLPKKPYSIKSLNLVAKIHEAKLEDLMSSLDYQFLPIPPFTSILLSQVNSIYDIPEALTQLRLDFQDLRKKFVELETEIYEAATIKEQLNALNNFKSFWAAFNKKYQGKNKRIFYGTLDFFNSSDGDKAVDTFVDSGNFSDSIKDLNVGKLAVKLITESVSWYKDKKAINRFKGLTNIWELFQGNTNLVQQIKHFERIFGVQFENADIKRVNDFVKTKLNDITKDII